MTDTEYRRALLLARIEAHRSILRLELRLARATFDPWSALFSLLGVERAVAGTVAASLRSLLGRQEGLLGAGGLVPLLVAALLPLVDRLRGGEPAERAGGANEQSRTEKED